MTSINSDSPETILEQCLMDGFWPGVEYWVIEGAQLFEHWFSRDWPTRQRLPRSLNARCLALLERAGSTICTVRYKGKANGVLALIACRAFSRCDLATVLYAALRGASGFVAPSFADAFCGRSGEGVRLSVAQRVNFVEAILAIEPLSHSQLNKASEELISMANDDPEEYQEPLEVFLAWRDGVYREIHDPDLCMIEAMAAHILHSLRLRSGKVFYSGRRAFNSPSGLYVLGANPGGDPVNHNGETVGAHTVSVLGSYPDDWSAFRDEAWEGFTPGSYGMAPRVLHLFSGLGLNPGEVPCTNLVFARSSREADIGDEMLSLADQCWTIHAYAIDRLAPRVVLCLGKTAGNYVRQRIGANTLIGEFIEQNNRGWKSQAFASPTGPKVVVATHPSRANWCAAATDPTPLVREALK